MIIVIFFDCEQNWLEVMRQLMVARYNGKVLNFDIRKRVFWKMCSHYTYLFSGFFFCFVLKKWWLCGETNHSSRRVPLLTRVIFYASFISFFFFFSFSSIFEIRNIFSNCYQMWGRGVNVLGIALVIIMATWHLVQPGRWLHHLAVNFHLIIWNILVFIQEHDMEYSKEYLHHFW